MLVEDEGKQIITQKDYAQFPPRCAFAVDAASLCECSAEDVRQVLIRDAYNSGRVCEGQSCFEAAANGLSRMREITESAGHVLAICWEEGICYGVAVAVGCNKSTIVSRLEKRRFRRRSLRAVDSDQELALSER
jgi:hypothetical protein